MTFIKNKTELNKLLVEERKKMRAKAKASEFMKRTLSIYNGQKSRYTEWHEAALASGRQIISSGNELPFTIDQFRDWLRPLVDTKCGCGAKMTIKGLAVDHQIPIARHGSFELCNLACLCKSCNFRKGQLLPDEFEKLKAFANTLSAESREDLWRRLTLGGKWSFGK